MQFKKDNKYYIVINEKIYGPYYQSDFVLSKNNKAYIAYIQRDELIISEAK
jgi:hypothetical protein